MLRRFGFASCVTSGLARLQSTASAASAVVGGRRRNNRSFMPTRLLPKFEIHDVRDEPALGSMTRVSVDNKQLLISQYPQLGPRKQDPNDVTPQFDRDRRISIRLRHVDLGSLVAVVEDRLPRHRMKNRAYDLVFEKTPAGYVLHGQVHRTASEAKEELAIKFEQQFAVTVGHFLENALTESFGFRPYLAALAPNTNRNQNNFNNRGGAYGTSGRTARNSSF